MVLILGTPPKGPLFFGSPQVMFTVKQPHADPTSGCCYQRSSSRPPSTWEATLQTGWPRLLLLVYYYCDNNWFRVSGLVLMIRASGEHALFVKAQSLICGIPTILPLSSFLIALHWFGKAHVGIKSQSLHPTSHRLQRLRQSGRPLHDRNSCVHESRASVG